MKLQTIDIFFGLLCVLFFVISLCITHALSAITKSNKENGREESADDHSELKILRKGIAAAFVSVIGIYAMYHFSVQYKWQGHVMEWLNLVIRWAHVVFGIAWIGASFYFIFLENSLNRTKNLRNELAGNLWAIHGGGFYYVEKYKSAPENLPEHLHWFKYEAYFTWLTGFLLLTLVYFMNAKAMMVDANVRNISPQTAIGVSIASIILVWLIYDGLCKTSLLARKQLFALIGFLIVIFISFILTKILSGRAAFMMVGVLLGSIMAGNVFFCIIPSQKALVHAAKTGKQINPELGKVSGLRSLHNNYITLPVIFIMISNHFPVTFGPHFNWLILILLFIAGVSVRHFINLYEKGVHARWMIPLATISILSLVYVTAPERKKSAAELPPVPFAEVQNIVQRRCITCHSSKPTDDVNVTPPNGLMFDLPEQIAANADKIMIRVVQTKTMPQGNKTNITEEERSLLGVWIEQGAKLR